MTAERRRAVVEHLTWLAALVVGGTETVSPAAAGVRDAAAVYGADGMTAERAATVRAIDVLLGATTGRERWTGDDVLRVACGNLPWMLDDVPLRGGPALVLPGPPDAAQARARAAEYRRRRVQLWILAALVRSGLPA